MEKANGKKHQMSLDVQLTSTLETTEMTRNGVKENSSGQVETFTEETL